MNRSQRNAKAKAKGLRKARRKKKIDKIRNTEKKTPTYSNEEVAYRSLNISASNKYMLNPYMKHNPHAKYKSIKL
jgi:hypothetical protein